MKYNKIHKFSYLERWFVNSRGNLKEVTLQQFRRRHGGTASTKNCRFYGYWTDALVALMVVGTTVATPTVGQTQTTLPSDILGTWTRTTISSIPGGSLTLVDTITFTANGNFRYSTTATSPLPGGCTLDISSFVEGSTVPQTSSTLEITTSPGTLTSKNSCGTTTTNIIPTLKGTLSWERQVDSQRQKLCLDGRLSETNNSGSVSISFNDSCHYRQ